MLELIKTKHDLCTGCNRCVRECPMETADITWQDEDGNIRVQVDHTKCIACGWCISACHHNARYYEDDTASFFEDLKNGVPISVIAAPSIQINIPEYKKLFTYLKGFGVKEIYDVSLGADICVWAHIRMLETGNVGPIITQPCPAIVSYCKIHRHDLLEKLSPIHSPMACTAIYMKEYIGVEGRIAALSPCIAKTNEFNLTGLVQYNVTFTHLRDYLNKNNIRLPYEETKFSHESSGLGSLLPMPGGLKENIDYILNGKLHITKSEGVDVYKKLDEYSKAPEYFLPDIFDVLNCRDGCNIGSACYYDRSGFEIEKAMKNRRGKIVNASIDNYYQAAYKTYDDTLDLSKFFREYNAIETSHLTITENDISKAYAMLGKTDYDKQHVDCGACGSDTCYNMARKIALGANTPVNCMVMAIESARTSRMEAEDASHAKSSFLASMSHEIRTPMNAIIGMTSVGTASADMERMKYCFERINDASKHLLGIINDILDMSKIEAGKFELTQSEFSFERMLQRVVNVVNFRVDEQKQKLTVYIDRDIPQYLVGDDQRLAQVITNLLGNAIKFTPEKGAINIKTYFKGEEKGLCTIKVSVKDTGIGITPEQQSNLFQSFQQAESDTSRKYGGTGLGLAISKNIVEMMGGGIEVESEIGKGATFTFTFQAKRGETKNPINSNQKINWSNVRILVVDDDKYILDDFKGIIKKLGAVCDTAENAEDALSLVKRNGEYNLYFIDWKMPGMDGIQLTSELIKRAQARDKSVMILFSAVELSAIAVKAKEAGVDKILQKPLFPSTIADVVSEYLGVPVYKIDKPGTEITNLFKGKRILLAEDVEINREIVMALLEPTGLEIVCAENGVEAVNMFNASPDRYDMIFMDVQMPEINGYEATKRIRALDITNSKTIPIIAMTANVFREDVEKCLEAGMDSHIGKPINIDEVMEVMKKYFLMEKSEAVYN